MRSMDPRRSESSYTNWLTCHSKASFCHILTKFLRSKRTIDSWTFLTRQNNRDSMKISLKRSLKISNTSQSRTSHPMTARQYQAFSQNSSQALVLVVWCRPITLEPLKSLCSHLSHNYKTACRSKWVLAPRDLGSLKIHLRMISTQVRALRISMTLVLGRILRRTPTLVRKRKNLRKTQDRRTLSRSSKKPIIYHKTWSLSFTRTTKTFSQIQIQP